MRMKQTVRSRAAKLLLSLLGLSLAAWAQTGGSAAAEQSIEAALRARNFSQAYELSRSAVAESPRNPRLLALEAYALMGLGRRSEALNAYNTALSVSPDYLPALEGAAQLEYDAGAKRAAGLLEKILKLHPGEPTAHAMLAVIDYRRHDCASAVSHFAAARQVISSQPVALVEYGSCLVEQDHPQEAIPIFQQILAQHPEDARARYNLAVVELAANQGKDAIAILEPLVEAARPDPDVLDLASSAYEQAGDTPNAVKLLRQAIVLDPKKLKYYVDFATISFTHQSFQVGVDMINAGLEANPQATQLYVARGVLYIQLGQYDQGEADFETANRLDPRQSSGAIAEGLAQMQQSNLDQALATVRSQLQSHSQDAFLHYMEGQVLFQRGVDPGTPEFKQAIAAAELSEKLRPDFELVHDLLGNLYLKSGQMERSIEQSRLALHENPSDQEALYHLIQALRESHRDTKGELPALVKRLAELRQEARNSEASNNRYKLYEPSAR
jgi:tetratricopeptide (TPR) repeat protein